MFSYFITCEPDDWYKKEITYHLPGNRKEVQIFERPEPQQFAHDYSQTNYTRNSLNDQVNNTVSRTSFGSSSNSYLSKMGSFKSYNKEESQPMEGKNKHNPYELNERSFLKNKMKSMTHLFETEHIQNNKE